MPPALSDEEGSDYESPMPAKSTSSSRVSAVDEDDEGFEQDDVEVKRSSSARSERQRGKAKAAPVADADGDEHERDEDVGEVDGGEEEGDEDEALEEDEFVVEEIKKHMIDEDGSLKFQVKWEGYHKKSDLTWEPEENLKESANEILTAYMASVGGRESIFEQSQEASRGKKRGRTSSTTPGALPKRSRKNGVHPGDSTPPAAMKKLWSPPAGSWEDEIESIDACEDEGSNKLVVYLVWKNGRKTKHDTTVIYKKCPQKMLLFYERHVRIVREENKAQVE